MRKGETRLDLAWREYIHGSGDIHRFVAIESRLSNWEDRQKAFRMTFDAAFKMGQKHPKVKRHAR